MKPMFDWLMETHLLMVEWRYVSMGCGAQCVMIGGMTEMHRWCVDNWDMLEVSFNSTIRLFSKLLLFSLTASTPLKIHYFSSGTLLFYHLDDIHCNGNEDLLSECEHNGLGFHDCATRLEEAGVLCSNGLFFFRDTWV